MENEARLNDNRQCETGFCYEGDAYKPDTEYGTFDARSTCLSIERCVRHKITPKSGECVTELHYAYSAGDTQNANSSVDRQQEIKDSKVPIVAIDLDTGEMEILR